MEKPLISVIMGVFYQHENTEFLQRAVNSILEQRDVELELLICDDGSTDEACVYLDSCAANDSRIVLLRPGKAFTLPEKLNCCLRAAKGKYIARMDDDDYSYPNRLMTQLHYLENSPEIAFCGSNVGQTCEGKYTGKRILPEFPTVRDFYMTQPYIHPTLLFRRECLEMVDGYSEDKHCILCEDYDLFLRLYEKGYHGANLQEILFDYTIPTTARGSRKMKHRWNETVTRWRRFRALGVLPKALPYVVKPMVVGVIPERVLKYIKIKRVGTT